MPSNPFYSLEHNESFAIITWNEISLTQSNSEELELAIRNLFKKEFANMILNLNNIIEMDGFGVSCIRKGTKICTNEMGLFAVVTQNEEIQDRLDLAKIENFTLLNTVKEAVDAIYLNDLENDFQDSDDEEQEFDRDFSDSESDDY
jgi:anti-anti-sigma regulatory factor